MFDFLDKITIYQLVLDDQKNKPLTSERQKIIEYLEEEISNARCLDGHQVEDAISGDVGEL